MKKTTAALALILALLLPLAACGERDRARPASSAPAPSSHSLRSEPEAESDPQPENTPADPAAPLADDALVREIIKIYGAEEITDEDGTLRLKTKTVSLFFNEESWDNPEELDCISYFGWFLSTTLDEDYQYKLEHYIHPDIGENQGWFFPQDIYEARIQTYFAVSTDHLRSDALCYSPELGGYWIGGGGGRGEEPRIDYRYSQEGDLLTVEVDLLSRFSDLPARRILNVHLEADGGWKYLGYRVPEPQ